MNFRYSNNIVQEDLRRMATPELCDALDNKTVMVAGATGMLATYITFFLCFLRNEYGVNVTIVALCRTKSKADSLYAEFYREEWFTLLLQDICEPIRYEGNVDYIFHLAGNASPYFIKNDPVGIVKSNLLGTFNILEFAKDRHIKNLLFASTREVYGKNEDKESLKETDFGTFDCLEPRACYPESKRAAETICQAYCLQHGVPFCAVRIAHSYGPGMNLRNDGRVMADLMSNAVDGKDIILKSDGTAERAFCYITDAVSAMFLVLINGGKGKAYNIANETEPITIGDLAHRLAEISGVKVVFDIPQQQSNAYCNYRRSGLDCHEVAALGWNAMVSLEEGLMNTYEVHKSTDQ